MKRLLLLRHAKAVPHGTVNDFERVLADKGRSDMTLVAHRIATQGPAPDIALVSPSARTRETWSLSGLPRVPVRFEDTMYEATLRALLRLIQALPETVGLPILVGHNPSLEEFVGALKADAPLRKLPTATLVLAEWPVETWRQVELRQGRLVELVTPAMLGGSDSD